MATLFMDLLVMYFLDSFNASLQTDSLLSHMCEQQRAKQSGKRLCGEKAPKSERAYSHLAALLLDFVLLAISHTLGYFNAC